MHRGTCIKLNFSFSFVILWQCYKIGLQLCYVFLSTDKLFLFYETHENLVHQEKHKEEEEKDSSLVLYINNIIIILIIYIIIIITFFLIKCLKISRLFYTYVLLLIPYSNVINNIVKDNIIIGFRLHIIYTVLTTRKKYYFLFLFIIFYAEDEWFSVWKLLHRTTIILYSSITRRNINITLIHY